MLKRLALAIVVLCTALGSSWFGASGTADASKTFDAVARTMDMGTTLPLLEGGTISGYVFDAATHLPVAGASVAAYYFADPFPLIQYIQSTTTDSSGYYSIAEIPVGDYYVRALAVDYIKQYYDHQTISEQSTGVSIGSGTSLSCSFDLTYGAGSISGSVTGPGGSPVEGAMIVAYVADVEQHCNGGYSDGSGAYRVPNLPPGVYKVKVLKDGFSQWFNGRATFEEADTVIVDALSQTAGVNLTVGVDADPPPVPDLVYPTDGKITADSTPWLDWSDVTDPSGVTYRLQVDNNADFSSPVVSKSGLTTSSRTITLALPDETYYWRVRAVDGVGNISVWTAAWSFTVDTVTPSMPSLLYPANGKVTKDNTPWLDWSDVTDATGVKYQLQVDNNADFSSPVFSKTGMTASSRTLGTLADGTYYWRTRAVDGAGNYTAWTAAWSFTVDTTVPSLPVLLYPANGTVTTDTTPWLDWSDVTDPTGVKYQLQVDNNADFSSPVVNKSGLTTSSRTLSTLAAGTYYWRVRVVDGAGNASAWTAAWSFTVV